MAYMEYLKHHRSIGSVLYWLNELTKCSRLSDWACSTVDENGRNVLYVNPWEKIVMAYYTWNELVPVFYFQGEYEHWNFGLKKKTREHLEYLEKNFGFINKYIDPEIARQAERERFRKIIYEGLGLGLDNKEV